MSNNNSQISKMRQGGKRLKRILLFLQKQTKIGIATQDLATIALKLIKKYQGRASFLGYRGFPAPICISLNDEIVHGIPSNRKIENGDIISLDLGFYYQGYHTDAAITFGVGVIKPESQKLISASKTALRKALEKVIPGNTIGDIGFTIKNTILKFGFTPIYDLSGHGIGKNIHQKPSIPNFGVSGSGLKLKKGMIFTIEPMAAEKNSQIITADDGWTIKTKDGGLSSHFEETIAVGLRKAEILT